VLWIRDLLVRIRIRTNDLQIQILLYSSVAEKMPTKQAFLKLLCLLLSEDTLPSVFIDKKSKESQQNSRNRGFSYFLHVDEYKDVSGWPQNIRFLRIQIPTLLFGLTKSAPEYGQ
jgi:hypothetical protein